MARQKGQFPLCLRLMWIRTGSREPPSFEELGGGSLQERSFSGEGPPTG